MKSKKIVVGKIDELRDGEMKKIEIDDHEILLIRIDGKYYAVSGTCTHYGASLEEGVLSGERLYCPWHHACFNAKTGNLEEPPARDALAKFEVKLDGENIVLIVPDKVQDKRTPKMASHDPEADDRSFVIVGGGAAGNMAAQTLREDGFQGKVAIITKENHLPYDRPNLSKLYLQGEADESWMPLRSKEFYDKHNIDILFEKEVKSVKPSDKKVIFENDESLAFDKLLIASGSIPRMLDVPGADLKNIFSLRSWDDADLILKQIEGAPTVAVVGASFIGMEVADSLIKRKLPVTVIAPESVPFENVFGREIGNMFQQLHIENGVDFRLNSKIKEFKGDEKVNSVVLQDGERIDADLVIVGIGVKPATDFLEEIDLLPDGSVQVNEYFEVTKDIYAAGDIATFENVHTKENIRIEHWRNAEQQGRHAAHNMAGIKKTCQSVPFFWTTQADLHFRYVGHAVDWDEIILQGAINFQKFLAYFVKNGQVHAVAGNQQDQKMNAIEQLMWLDKMPSVDELRKGDIDLLSLVK